MITVWNRPCGERERGSITLFTVVFFLAVLAATGLVVDGGAKLRAARQASAIAEEAARAGAGRINQDHAYTRGGTFIIDRNAAQTAARTYLSSGGHTGTVQLLGSRQLRVTVTVGKPTILLNALGIDGVQVTKTATADLLQGINAGR